MASRIVRPMVGFVVGASLCHAAGCGTITPPWRTSHATRNEPTDEGAGLDLAALPSGVRIALENGMFRDCGGDENGGDKIESPSKSGVGLGRLAPPVDDRTP